ncbi:MAG: hypothetical protein CVU22_24550, partial [Betaproteobacteria bacterium HGW-Betaproteobacteria-16]
MRTVFRTIDGAILLCCGMADAPKSTQKTPFLLVQLAKRDLRHVAELRAVALFFRKFGLAGSRPGGRVSLTKPACGFSLFAKGAYRAGFAHFAKQSFANTKVTKERRAEVRGPSGFLALLASWGKFANLSAARPSD